MEHGIYLKSRNELVLLAEKAAERKAWDTFNRLVAEMSCRDRYDRHEAVAA